MVFHLKLINGGGAWRSWGMAFYCAGNDDYDNVYCIPELDFFHPTTRKILENSTVERKDLTEAELEEAILSHAAAIKERLRSYLDEVKPDCLIPNNLLSVGYHIPALIALSEIIEETGIPTVAHNHDFTLKIVETSALPAILPGSF